MRNFKVHDLCGELFLACSRGAEEEYEREKELAEIIAGGNNKASNKINITINLNLGNKEINRIKPFKIIK